MGTSTLSPGESVGDEWIDSNGIRKGSCAARLLLVGMSSVGDDGGFGAVEL